MRDDVVSRWRVHAAYIWGGFLILAGQSLRNTVGVTDAWHAVARWILN